MNLHGAVALVTGASSGLGEATSRALVEAGARVVLVDRDEAGGRAVATDLGEAARFVQADVTREDEVRAAVATAASLGPLRAAVSCAGVGLAQRALGKDGTAHDLGRFERVLAVNLLGTFNVTRLCAEHMARGEPDAEGQRGALVHTASIAAFDGQIGQAAYAASKGGIVAMTLPLARDLARHGIRCNVVCPGTMDTPLLAGLPEPARTALEATIPFPARLGRPSEFAALVRHVLENDYLNGATLRLDGALRMPPR